MADYDHVFYCAGCIRAADNNFRGRIVIKIGIITCMAHPRK